MFPLGSVLFPHALLPLRVFEPRYLQMVSECLEGDRESGVVLIERGPEVGGGDQRFNTGTIGRILRVAELEDGHLAVAAAGVRRIRVDDWLPDDPYPSALVSELDDTIVGVAADAAAGRAEQELRRVLALYSELGHDVGDTTIRLDSDPCVASFQACAVAPTGPLDGQALLEINSAAARLTALADLLADEAAVVSRRLAET
jgi:Lon protease-like protein